MVLSFECVDGILKYDPQIKAIEQYIPAVSFILPCKKILIYQFLKCATQTKAVEPYIPGCCLFQFAFQWRL